MLFTAADYNTLAIRPDYVFESVLPSSNLLNDTVLDPGLSTSAPGRQGATLKKFLIKQAALDSLHLQQFTFYDVAATTGILSTFADVLADAMGTVALSGELSTKQMTEQLITTGIGLAADMLSAVPNIYAQIAGALIGFGLMIYDLFKDEPERLPDFALPPQRYDEETDAGQFNAHVRAALQESTDYTSFFMPRFRGDLTVQYRKDDTGRWTMAWGLGDGTVGENAQFNPSGGRGFIPGGRQITGIIQTRWPEKPNDDRPYIEGRCGGCTVSALTLGRDVGTFYPSTNNGLLALWDHCLKLCPAMYNVDTHRLRAAWEDHMEAWADGLDYAWEDSGERDKWGTGGWRCAVREATRLQTVGINDEIGTMSYAGPFDGCQSSWPKSDFRKASVNHKIIKRALNMMREAQHYYLEKTTIAAYLPPHPGFASDQQEKQRIKVARQRILQTSARWEVRRKDVVDREYEKALEDAGAFVPSFQRTLALKTEKDRPQISGLALPPDAPPPPDTPEPAGGTPFGDYIPKKKKKFPVAAAAALGGTAFFFLR